ncbi:two-component system response regulator [Campylobacter blaseri]|uniref:Two-component system response regulator n=1 Tax=Campylobacter blaseri TaxID=2042961 RepID=A0A2P8QYX3_9BACT|nr:response regulator transcription factor [Campylobacter blaseri]PSM51448.1 two-component system response regulator [Campylobacter blaseri]PSM52897.1 two-component system response regulator [Campylobacter blaseri]QKF86549.1 two-component system response regulator [Campylobacter blaseri]
MKILLLEDDDFICEQVKNYFELNGHRVDFYNDGQTLLDNADLTIYDIFLLDINTPIKNGIETLKQIRKTSDTPAIYLTAMNDLENVKEGYSAGCNDYVRKPFMFEELELRINKLMHKDSAKIMDITNNYSFDLNSMQLYYKEEIVELNSQEKELLYLLVKNIGTAMSPEVIINYVWEGKDICDNTLRTKIKKLREKLRENFIINVRNIGYKIEKYA